MLKFLSIKNLSVIQSVALDFAEGLNIITGETGAGKSLIIQALKLLVGERFSRDMARDPDEKVVVEGVFDISSLAFDELTAEEFDIKDEIIVKRIIDPSGKSRAFVNGHIATLVQLSHILEGVVDFHGQHDHQHLLNTGNHIKYLDALVDEKLKTDYAELYHSYRTLTDEINKLKKDYAETVRNKEIFEFQLNEIKDMSIDIERDSELENRISFLSNIENIKKSLSASLEVLSEGEYNALEMINNALREISGVLHHYQELEKTHTRLQDIYYELDDCVNVLSHMFYEQAEDSGELDNLINRKVKLDNLMKKYGATLSDVLNFAENLEEKLDNLTFDEDRIEQLETERDKLIESLNNSANRLNTARRETAKRLGREVENILHSIELKDAVFEVAVELTDKIDSLAGAKVEFFISTNKGFKPAPLKKVASGGELSRIMLALKEVFSNVDNTPALVFDEIDTGISGVTARKVAEKLYNLSLKKQLFVITHLPVVASKGNKHIHISKKTVNNNTYTEIKVLTGEEKKSVLATMIAGEVTPHAVKQAEELLRGTE